VSSFSSTLYTGLSSNLISLSSNILAFWMPWSLRNDSTKPTASLIDSNWL